MGADYRVTSCPDGLITDRRRDVKVMDCTIRDGGLLNAWRFDRDLVRATFEALVGAGIDGMEIGYMTQRDAAVPESVGPWRFTEEQELRTVARESGMQLAVMLDMGKADADLLLPADESLVDLIRVATYARDVDGAIELLHSARDLGYATSCNVMAVSTNTQDEVDSFLERLRDSYVDRVVVVDSFGAMFPHHVRYLVRKYKNWLRQDQLVGVHLHNNTQTAFANTIAAIDEGADWVDATVHGMGRGAGNCPLELLLMYLDDPRYDVRPILELIDDYARLRDHLRWGYHLPYVITGWLNQHPRPAIARMQRDDRYRILDFFEELTADRPPPRHHRPNGVKP